MIDLTSTNALVLPLPPPVPREQEALDRITGPVPANNDTTPFNSTRRQIGALEPNESVDDDQVDERIERSRMQLLMEEVELRMRRQDTDGAIRLLNDALPNVGFDLSRFAIHHRLGTIYFRVQDYVSAAEHMAAALEIQPNNAAMASNLAAAQMTLGRLDDALETLTSIQLGLIQNRQLLFSIHFNLSCLYSMKQREEEAIQHLYQAAENDPPSVYTSLGDPQLDNIRGDMRFRELQLALENMMGPR